MTKEEKLKNGIDFLNSKNYDKALVTFKSIIRENDKYVDGYIFLGITHTAQSNDPDAIKAFSKALKLDFSAQLPNNVNNQFVIKNFKEAKEKVKNLNQVKKTSRDLDKIVYNKTNTKTYNFHEVVTGNIFN